MSATQALEYARENMPPFTEQQVAQLAQLAQEEQVLRRRLPAPIWFYQLQLQIEDEEKEEEEEEEGEEDWMTVTNTSAIGSRGTHSAQAPGSPQREIESPPPIESLPIPQRLPERGRYIREISEESSGRGKPMVRMPYDEFVKEHKHLLDVLSKGDRKSLREEYASQKAELGRHGKF